MNSNYGAKLESRVAEILKNDITAHDIHHSRRVHKLARKIGDGEGWDYDAEIVQAIAFLHDTGYTVPESAADQYVSHPRFSAEIARKLLPEVGFPKSKVETVVQGVLLHDMTKPWSIANRIPTDIKEILMIQDADNVEGMGAMGVARILLYSFRTGMTIYDPELPLNDPTANRKSAIHNLLWHLNLDENLNTETAKRMVQERKQRAKTFVDQFLEEFVSN